MIAVVGEALIDAHLDGDAMRLFPGGGPFNTAVALARLGVPVGFLGAISRDRLGQLLEETLTSAGVDTHAVLHVDDPTPIAIVDRGTIEPSYSFHLAGTAHQALQRGNLPALDDDVSAVHVGSLALATDPPGSVVEAFAQREARRRVLMVDPNVRPALTKEHTAEVRRFERLVAVADLVKLSDADLSWLYPGAGYVGVVDRLLSIGAPCVVLTRGPAGARGWTQTASASVATPAVAVVDTVGAGDAFGAGLLAWLWRSDLLSTSGIRRLRGDELQAALAYATAAGAAQCTRPSAWGPTAADVTRVLEGRAVGQHSEEDEWQRSSSIR